MALIILGATIIDGIAARPIEGHAIWIEGQRIQAIGPYNRLELPADAQAIDARGKFIIPGLMNANVHLYLDISMENLIRNEGRYEDVILEAAQVALKGGLTTVFDTWGPRQPLMNVRDRINDRRATGSRIFCAGNIVGLDGPFSLDFMSNTLGVASNALARRINSIWAENVGPDLTWMTPQQVGQEIRTYTAKGVDFIKYASSEHRAQPHEATASLLFSLEAQRAIVEEAHRAGLTAQAHTSAVEALRVAVEAGCDLIQHCNITGPVPIPEATIERMVARKTGAVIFPFTERRLARIKEKANPMERRYFSTVDANCRRFIHSGALILMANDGYISRPQDLTWQNSWMGGGEDNLADLGQGHFVWMSAMEEKGMAPMDMLRAATRNVAAAYGKEKDLGTLEMGKIADLLILDKNPLESAQHYRSIHMIIKEGAIVDRDSLPLTPILSKPLEPTDEDSSGYGRYAFSKYPCCH